MHTLKSLDATSLGLPSPFQIMLLWITYLGFFATCQGKVLFEVKAEVHSDSKLLLISR